MRNSCRFSSQFEIWFLKAIFILQSCVTYNTRCCYLFSLHWETFPHIYIYEVEGLIWICVWILICDIDFHFGLFSLHLIDPSSYEIYTFLYIQHIKCVTLWRQQKKNLIVSMWACFKFNFLSSFSWHVMKGNYLISNDLYVTSIYVRKVRVIFFNVAWK